MKIEIKTRVNLSIRDVQNTLAKLPPKEQAQIVTDEQVERAIERYAQTHPGDFIRPGHFLETAAEVIA